MRQPRCRYRAADQLGAGILLAVAGGLRAAEGRERVHAVDHAGLFESVPDRLVFRLHRVVAHRIHRADQRHSAAQRCDTADLLDRVIGVLHRNERREEQPFRICPRVFVGPFVVGAAERLGAERVLQPRVDIDFGRDDHDLIDSLNVHVPEARLGLVGSGMVQIGNLLLGQRCLGVQVADIEGPLDIVLDPRPGIGDDPHCAGDAALARRAEPDPGAAVNDQEPAIGIPPDSALQRVELVAGQEILRALPD